MDYLKKLNEISSQLPISVLEDINRRISDWLASGGNEDDAYIEQQFRYAMRFVKK